VDGISSHWKEEKHNEGDGRDSKLGQSKIANFSEDMVMAIFRQNESLGTRLVKQFHILRDKTRFRQ
jgi:hypothetical protein